MSFLIQLFWPYNFSWPYTLWPYEMLYLKFLFFSINLSVYWLPEERGCLSKPTWSLVKTHVGGQAYGKVGKLRGFT